MHVVDCPKMSVTPVESCHVGWLRCLWFDTLPSCTKRQQNYILHPIYSPNSGVNMTLHQVAFRDRDLN